MVRRREVTYKSRPFGSEIHFVKSVTQNDIPLSRIVDNFERPMANSIGSIRLRLRLEIVAEIEPLDDGLGVRAVAVKVVCEVWPQLLGAIEKRGKREGGGVVKALR